MNASYDAYAGVVSLSCYCTLKLCTISSALLDIFRESSRLDPRCRNACGRSPSTARRCACGDMSWLHMDCLRSATQATLGGECGFYLLKLYLRLLRYGFPWHCRALLRETGVGKCVSHGRCDHVGRAPTVDLYPPLEPSVSSRGQLAAEGPRMTSTQGAIIVRRSLGVRCTSDAFAAIGSRHPPSSRMQHLVRNCSQHEGFAECLRRPHRDGSEAPIRARPTKSQQQYRYTHELALSDGCLKSWESSVRVVGSCVKPMRCCADLLRLRVCSLAICVWHASIIYYGPRV